MITRNKLGQFAGKFRRAVADVWFKSRVILAAITLMAFGHVWISWAEAPAKVEAEIETATTTIEYVTVTPEKHKANVMQRIAGCESEGNPKSKGSHYRKDGTLRKNINKDGSIDFGKYQINTVNEKEAASLGFDIYSEEGNEGYAMWLYDNRGTEPWYSSAHCWRK